LSNADFASRYWDQSLDQVNFAASPVFHPVFGFGGNGVEVPGSSGPWNNLSFIGGFTGGGCVPNGPFAPFLLHIGPGTSATTHCLTRGFNTVATGTIGQDLIANMYKQPTFGQFRVELEGTPSTDTFRIHDSGHLAVCGEMCDRYSSNGGTCHIRLLLSLNLLIMTSNLDPLFYLHHANLDRHWATWQSQDRAKRLTDIAGVSSLNPPFANVTLDFKLKMDVLAPLVPIRDVMDTRSMCYTYV
jgi:tyrosinase